MSKKKRQKKYKPRVIQRHITVQSELREMPDFKRLARAVVEMARQQIDSRGDTPKTK